MQWRLVAKISWGAAPENMGCCSSTVPIREPPLRIWLQSGSLKHRTTGTYCTRACVSHCEWEHYAHVIPVRESILIKSWKRIFQPLLLIIIPQLSFGIRSADPYHNAVLGRLQSYFRNRMGASFSGVLWNYRLIVSHFGSTTAFLNNNW
jgi:hypothetical protein